MRSTRDNGYGLVRDGDRMGDEVHIHFVGPGFAATNPEVQKVVYGANQYAREVYGENARIVTHRK